ncbi:Crp/Fnr family transcriptional regulator [Actinomadura sp. BRA 177]|uniref:Crp/Fnr family transcriptional regulator n=1 Tax=Actinomadura sp. BRA 177 TaxID=2745202 RepID=UPI0015959175|nr:Crp/Fnr family transcriptional regulator [Actinomadura sp. BRA 177]NVI88479.1 Crp/Fnr family transcriptional regulator [Actinomadura sp. BRA 177]
MRTLPLREIHRDDASCVRRVPLFSGLTPEQQDLVGTLAHPVMLTHGELVYSAGERSGRLAVVHSGQIKLSRTLPSGRHRLLRVAEAGETLGEHGFLTGDATVEEAEALTDAQLCVFSHDDLTKLVTDYPRIAMRMLRSLGERLAEAERRLTLSTLDVDIRLADYLLLQPLLPADHPQVRLPLSKKHIASLLGTTPESLSRALSRLVRQS